MQTCRGEEILNRDSDNSVLSACATFNGACYVMLQKLGVILTSSWKICGSRILHVTVDVSSTIEEGRAVWL